MESSTEDITINGRKEIIELFPDLDLAEVFLEYSHLSTNALAHLILEKRSQIPLVKKKHGLCARLLIKTYASTLAIATSVTRRIPTWLGGKIFDHLVHSIEYHEEDEKNHINGIKETLECCVCWESAPVAEMCFCDPLAAKQGTASKVTHSFCRNCLEQHAVASADGMPMAKGGLGLCCMMCENPITFKEISAFIPAELVNKLEERAAELCIIQAALNYMERCRKCNCAVELGRSPQQMKVFKCPECKYEFCRLCDEQWGEAHEGISCEEYLRRHNGARLLEKRLSEAVVRSCPKCKLNFVKNDGCNKITCSCGNTQCYICRTDNINYSHFCSCPLAKKRDSDGTYHCKKCDKKCLLWESAVPVEKSHMERIRTEVAKQKAKNEGDVK